MKISLKILTISLIASIIIFFVLAYAFYECHNKPHYGGALILMMMGYVVLSLILYLEISLTKEIMKPL